MKKFLSLIVAFFMMLTLIGCGNSYDFQSRFDLVFKDVDTNAVESNLTLPTKVGNLLIEWESSNPEVISNTGEVKRAKEDVKVTLKALMTYEKESETLQIEVTVKGIGEVALAKNTIKEALDGELKEYEVAGTVVAFNAQSFVIKDETGMIMSYHGSSFAQDVKLGDVVLLTGTTTVYGAAKQFGNATYSVVASDETNDGEPKEYTATELDKLVNDHADDKTATFTPEYVKVKGVVEVSGKYYNLKIEGTEKATGSLTYPIETEALTALNGKTIEVLAYLTGVTGPGRYLQLVYVSYKEVEGAPVEPEKPAEGKTIGEIIAAEDGNYETTGVVAGVNAQSFLIKDSTGIMLVYCGYNFAKDVKVGDKVKVSGATSLYGKAKQFGAGSTYTKTGTEAVDHGTVKELTAADCDAYAALETIKPEYVKVSGKLSVSNGKYFNIAIGGATIIGSLTYPLDVDAATALDGKDIELVGYVTGTSSSDKYLNFLALEYKALGSDQPEPEPNPEPEVKEKTIAEIIAAENGSFETTGVVVAFNAQSFLIKDETGIIMVYCGKSYAKDLAVGDKVKVSGETTVYGAAKQFGAGSTYEKIESVTVDHGQAAELTAAELDAYATMSAITPKFVKVKGTLAVSGSYFNLNIEGTTAVVGSLVYPVDTAALTALDGKELDVTAYLTGLTGVKYLQLVIVEYNAGEGEVTPQPNPNPNPSEQADAVISFADVANRTAFSTESQVWEQNGIKVTNNKASATSDVADYSNPVRFYKNTEVVIECAQNIAKIVITTAGESKHQIKADYTFDGATLSVDGKVATLVLNAAANSYTFVCANSQIRVASIEVYYAK